MSKVAECVIIPISLQQVQVYPSNFYCNLLLPKIWRQAVLSFKVISLGVRGIAIAFLDHSSPDFQLLSRINAASDPSKHDQTIIFMELIAALPLRNL